METRDFLLLAYAAFGGEVHGKTKLQKKAYFLGVMLAKSDELGYGPHFYGPYSPAVANANAELVFLGYLDESVAGAGAVNPQGFEVARYDYRLNDAGWRIAERKKKKYPQDWSSIKDKAEVLHRAGELDYMELSAAAKFYFVLTQHGGKATFEGIKDMASRLGWSIGAEELKKAADFLQAMGLITLS